jgi:hypothetical protein
MSCILIALEGIYVHTFRIDRERKIFFIDSFLIKDLFVILVDVGEHFIRAPITKVYGTSQPNRSFALGYPIPDLIRFQSVKNSGQNAAARLLPFPLIQTGNSTQP